MIIKIDNITLFDWIYLGIFIIGIISSYIAFFLHIGNMTWEIAIPIGVLGSVPFLVFEWGFEKLWDKYHKDWY